MRDQGVGSWTARRARMSPDRVAVVGEDGAWTWRELHERVTRLAHVLAAAGGGAGERIAYLGRNHPAFLETLFATARLGAVFVPLNWRLTPAELTFILADSGVRVLVHAPDQAGAVAALPALPTIAVDAGYERRLAGAPTDPLDLPVRPEDTCMILYTSGTTGRPKGVVLTHGNVTWNCVNLLLDVDVTSDEVTLVAAPMFHVAALNQTVLPTVLKGGRVVLVAAFDPAGMLELIARHRATFLFGVPTMFQAMAQAPQWEHADLSSVRSAICGGAPVPEALIRTYRARGVTLMQGYGLTEAAPGVLFLRRQESAVKLGSAGTPSFFTDVRLQRPDGQPARPGEPGEILVHGPNVMAGYWQRPDDTAAVLAADGWLRTGDIGVADADGYIAVRDRVKDMIISGGENVYPAEVEDALYRHPAVAQCAVVGMPDPTWGEVGRAVVVLRPGARITGRELLAFLAGRIANYKIPKSVVFTDALPRTGSGKILKRRLQEQQHLADEQQDEQQGAG